MINSVQTRLTRRWWFLSFCAVSILTASLTLFGCSMIKEITISQVDLAQVKDGEYEGEFDGGLVKAKVRVSVAKNQITELVILNHDNGRGGKAESIVDAVVATQSLHVDAVTGATYSSKVILKAIEIALQQGIGEQ